MNEHKRKSIIHSIVTLIMAVFAVAFISLMGFLNYKTTLTELKEGVILRVEEDTVDKVETAMKFGKQISNYYGTDEVFASFVSQVEGSVPFIISAEGKLMYTDSAYTDVENARIAKVLNSSEYERALKNGFDEESRTIVVAKDRVLLYPITQDEEVQAYFACMYSSSDLNSELLGVRDQVFTQTVIVAVCLCIVITIVLIFFASPSWTEKRRRRRSDQVENLVVIVCMSIGIITLAALSIVTYRGDYRDRIKEATKISLQNIENTLSNVSDQGVNIRTVNGLEDYISDRVQSLDTLRSVRISDHIAEIDRTNEVSDLVSFQFNTGEEDGKETYLYLEAEISSAAMNRQIRSIVLTLISTLVILLMFVFESTKFIELITVEENEGEFSEKKVSLSLRLTGFLCSTAEYMCVPYAAMMIRESGETLFGLSNGVTAALPLTMEGFAQMIAMLCLPKLVKKMDIKGTLVISSVLMVLCNGVAFITHAALTIVLCRTFAGVAYAGFKQISNYLITRGYNTDEGRSDNISQDNAGLLAGATCGAGLGAILSANLGYSLNFIIAAVVFVLYTLVTLFATPWNMLKQRSHMEEESKPISMAGIRRMIFSKEMIFFVIMIGIPLNIGVMLCVTLIPAICQTNGISSVMLSYCYIANGIAGIYIGPALVAKAKKRFGVPLSIAFAFALTAFGIFVLHIPPIMVMIVISSMVLGFLDGFGTPMVTDQFMSLKVVRNEVDESTALIFSVVLSYILLTFAPMIAELMLIPGKGFFSPMIIGVIVYALAAVYLILLRIRKGKEGSV